MQIIHPIAIGKRQPAQDPRFIQVTVRMRTLRQGQERNVQAPSPYQVEGDRLSVPDGLAGQVFAWTLRDGTLRLADLYGQVYLFVPAAATAP